MDFLYSCRICLTDGQGYEENNIIGTDEELNRTNKGMILKGLFIDTNFDNFFLYPATLLNDYFNAQITENDGFPQYICEHCLSKLRVVYTFKNALENSKLILMQYVQVGNINLDSVKNEHEDDDFSDVLQDPVESVQVKTECEKIENDDDDQPLSKILRKNKNKSKHKKKIMRIIVKKKDVSEPQSSSSKCFFCLVCDARFNEETKLYKHCCRKHKVIKKTGRNCDYCNDKLEDFRSLLVHRKRHLTPYLCEHCWTGYFTQEELDYHYSNCKKLNSICEDQERNDSQDMSDEKNLCQCHICGKAYSTSYFHCHMLIHGESKYRCEECGKSFKQPKSLQSHIQFIHKKEKNLKCSMCDLNFVTSGARSSHIRQTHQKEKKFMCEVCDKRFFGSYNLKKHMLTHSGMRDYTCDYCDKTYQSQHGLNVHLKSHSMEENTMRYELT